MQVVMILIVALLKNLYVNQRWGRNGQHHGRRITVWQDDLAYATQKIDDINLAVKKFIAYWLELKCITFKNQINI